MRTVGNTLSNEPLPPVATSPSRAPFPTDDLSEGYEVGSWWHYGGSAYVCTDATDGAAVWVDATETGGGGGPHTSTHQNGGGDAIKLDDLAIPDDNTDLDASTARHGLLKKLPGGTTTFLRADGAFVAPPGGAAGDLDMPEIGSLTVATGKWHLTAVRHQCTGAQRITLQGTGRLRISN